VSGADGLGSYGRDTPAFGRSSLATRFGVVVAPAHPETEMAALNKRVMIYLKSVLAGIAVAIGVVFASAFLVAVATFAWLQFEMRRDSGGGGIGAVSAGIAEGLVVLALILGLVGFVAGFRWQFRRASR
jgi:hypothetical protein